MKGKLRVIIITLVLLLIGTGVLLWKLNDISKEVAEQEEAAVREERDLLEEQKGKAIDETKSVDIIPLYMTGDRKNVVTTTFQSVREVYSAARSAEVEENLTNIKKNRIFSLQDALWAYNPFGTNRNSMYVYFKSNGRCYCRYTISVKDKKIPDFTRTAQSGISGNLTKEHEYLITGLVPGQTNYITMRLYNDSDELSEVRTFAVTIPKSRVGAPTILNTVKGRSKVSISNGLFVVFQDGNKVSGAKKYAILLYDNSGVLRGEIPTDGYCGKNLEEVYDTLLFASSRTQVAQINALGQVVKAIPMRNYYQDGEFTYDGFGNLFMIVSENRKKAVPRSKVVKMELETGKVSEMIDMNSLLSNVYKNAVKKTKKQNVDWVGLNSLKVVDAGTLLVSAKNLSSVFKISNIGSLMTKVDYIIADKKLYDPYKSLRKKVLTKSAGEDAEPEETPVINNILHKPVKKDPFVSQFGQEALGYKKRSTEGQSTITMLNCNIGNGTKSNGESYYYSYFVDEVAGTYELKEKKPLDQTKKDGNAVSQKDTFIYCCSDEGLFTESDMEGKLIRQYSTSKRPYRVYKKDFKGFWFY
ncbi:MAG: aryl-sulfate sulfotransferase [Lachnospiraceae bacterium]|jgi:hypothetical protein|nr:aryl-sulfate sulfotransferase [Lachnospiraceae bacterium]